MPLSALETQQGEYNRPAIETDLLMSIRSELPEEV